MHRRNDAIDVNLGHLRNIVAIAHRNLNQMVAHCGKLLGKLCNNIACFSKQHWLATMTMIDWKKYHKLGTICG
jgi:hypothetical protein